MSTLYKAGFAICHTNTIVVNGIVVPGGLSAVECVVCALVSPNSEVRFLYRGVRSGPIFSTQPPRRYGKPAIVALVY